LYFLSGSSYFHNRSMAESHRVVKYYLPYYNWTMAKKTISLYGGLVRVKFDSKGHKYFDSDDDLICNATGALKILNKPFLVPWSARMATEYYKDVVKPGMINEVEIARLHKAAATAYSDYSFDRMVIGSTVHDWIEAHVNVILGTRKNGKAMPVHPECLNGVNAFLNWEKAYNPTYLWSERIVYSVFNKHIGTADVGFTLGNSDPILGDWKTGSGVYYEHALQLAGYSGAIAEEDGRGGDWMPRAIIHLNSKNGKHKHYDEKMIQEKTTGHSVEKDYETFLNLVQMWYAIKDGPSAWQLLK